MPYEIFTRKVSRVGSPAVSLNNLGRIGLNQASTKFLEKEAIEFVLLLWDKEARRLALRPITKKDGRAYRISYGKKRNYAAFSAKTFFDFIQYDYSETRVFPAEWNEKEGILEVEIPAEHIKSQPGKTVPLEAGRRISRA